MRPWWPGLVVAMVAAVMSGVLSTLDPLLMRLLIDTELPQHKAAMSIALVFGIFACLIGSTGMLLWSMYLNFSVEQNVAQGIRVKVLDQLNRMSTDFHENTPVGDSMTRL